MSSRWTVDHGRQYFEVVGEGDIVRQDVEAVLDALADNGALGYRKLVDVRSADTSMTPDTFLELGLRARSMHRMGRMGPLAIVLPADRGAQAERFIGMLAAADRPMRIFWTIGKARNWLEAQQAAPGVAEAPPESRPAS
jgi:hypothetical protein